MTAFQDFWRLASGQYAECVLVNDSIALRWCLNVIVVGVSLSRRVLHLAGAHHVEVNLERQQKLAIMATVGQVPNPTRDSDSFGSGHTFLKAMILMLKWVR